MRVILGSGSPRRKYILEEIFGKVEIIIPVADERFRQNENASDYARRITGLKMDNVCEGMNFSEQFIVITSDTVVTIDDKILGKPLSRDHAFSMLKTLSGKEHFVITGVSVLFSNGDRIRRIYDAEKTSVFFKRLDDNLIRRYLGLVDCSDKAGSYAVQEYGDLIIQSVDGSLTNVIGFPLRLFFRIMNDLDVMAYI